MIQDQLAPTPLCKYPITAFGEHVRCLRTIVPTFEDVVVDNKLCLGVARLVERG